MVGNMYSKIGWNIESSQCLNTYHMMTTINRESFTGLRFHSIHTVLKTVKPMKVIPAKLSLFTVYLAIVG